MKMLKAHRLNREQAEAARRRIRAILKVRPDISTRDCTDLLDEGGHDCSLTFVVHALRAIRAEAKE